MKIEDIDQVLELGVETINSNSNRLLVATISNFLSTHNTRLVNFLSEKEGLLYDEDKLTMVITNSFITVLLAKEYKGNTLLDSFNHIIFGDRGNASFHELSIRGRHFRILQGYVDSDECCTDIINETLKVL